MSDKNPYTPPTILRKDILSDNWYKLYKYTYETVDKKAKSMFKAARHTTAATAPSSSSITKNAKPLS